MAAKEGFVRYSSVMTADGGARRTPGPPPEAVLLRLARKAAGISVEEAAKAAGISKAWLSSIENGYDTRTESGVRPVRAKDEVIARLAAFLNIGPHRLEIEGQRPDAAAVLREMQRQPDIQSPVVAAGIPEGDPVLEYVRSLPGLTTAQRESLEDIARSRGLSVTMRQGMVGWVLTVWQQQDQAQGRSA